MILKRYNNVPVFQFENITEHKGVKHFITTREGGFSTSPYNTFNFGYSVGDNLEAIEKNKEVLSGVIGEDIDQFFFPKQVHGDKIHHVINTDDHSEINLGCDGLITNKPGKVICVKGADCVPLLFFDSEKKVIGVAHAGWKGTIALIGQKMVLKMVEMFDSKTENILVGIGPSISQSCYEVSPALADQFKGVFGNSVVSRSKSKSFLDLWKSNKLQIIEAGVPEENIEISGLCTYSNPELFYSHRFSKGKTGRFVVGIVLE